MNKHKKMNMIKATQFKIVALMGIFLFTILVIIDVVIYTTGLVNEQNEAKRFLTQLVNRNNKPPHQDIDPGSSYFESRSFVVKFDTNGNISETNYDSNYYTIDYINEFAEKIANKFQNKNNIFSEENNIYYVYKLDDRGDKVLAASDYSIEKSARMQSWGITTIGLTAGLLALIFVTYFLSLWIVKPIEKSIEKQKHFISNASHELKTPLTIINANIDAIKSEDDDSKWLDNIKSQTIRMNDLIKDMLTLAKIEETSDISKKKIEFDISSTILNTILSFDAVAFEQHKSLNPNIDEGLTYKGDPVIVKNIITILVDNAIKHSSIAGIIDIKLYKNGNNIEFKIRNSGCDIKNSERTKVFDRFYKGDLSHNQSSGGSGLGLSIVKAIADQENWTISIDSNFGEYTEFTLTFI